MQARIRFSETSSKKEEMSMLNGMLQFPLRVQWPGLDVEKAQQLAVAAFSAFHWPHTVGQMFDYALVHSAASRDAGWLAGGKWDEENLWVFANWSAKNYPMLLGISRERRWLEEPKRWEVSSGWNVFPDVPDMIVSLANNLGEVISGCRVRTGSTLKVWVADASLGSFALAYRLATGAAGTDDIHERTFSELLDGEEYRPRTGLMLALKALRDSERENAPVPTRRDDLPPEFMSAREVINKFVREEFGFSDLKRTLP